ncbi:hypothetical protein SAY86_026849 [Trapa natans]|uniref:Protein root UVB sensitive/RUS domain-containing protein n=1 Tax=Trapa natans TaxID=22666 RepID=A0AAN7KEE4_TRANT|nr:hypothetical protein SAY86_026849 [Trapa natans]
MNSAPKFPALVASLRTPLHLELGEGEREVRKYYLPGEPGSVVRLPVTVTRSSEVSRYVWDATCLRLISFGGAGSDGGKRVGFSTSVLFSLSVGVELVTPTFPQYFLLLATIANIAKQISLACYLATGIRI